MYMQELAVRDDVADVAAVLPGGKVVITKEMIFQDHQPVESTWKVFLVGRYGFGSANDLKTALTLAIQSAA